MIRSGETDIVIERSGDFDETSFVIEAEDLSLILELIRNKLYSNKMGSYVREIISNAYDAMIEAGTDKSHKIQLILPTSVNNNVFTIRDFGTGMSDEKVKKIYTRVGKSTRSKSNKFVGMMGIGRLVGFCLTDSFNVTPYYNGVRTEYLCYIDETKCGKVAMLSQVETKELNGIAISVNVEPTLHYKLQQELDIFLSYVHDVNFEIINGEVHPFYNLKNIQGRNANDNVYFRGSGWVKYRNRINSVSAYVKMGIVKYPIPDNITKGKFFESGTFIFEVPIGAVSVSASREGLEFTPATTEYVNKLFADARVEVGSEMFTDLKSVKDLKTALQCFTKHEAVWRALDQPKMVFTEPSTKKDIDLYELQGNRYSLTTYRPANIIKIAGKPDEPEKDPTTGEIIWYHIKHNRHDYEARVYRLECNRRVKEDESMHISFSPAYYRIVDEHDIESLPDIRRCRTIYATSSTMSVYVFTKRGLDHFIKMEGYDPTVYWKKFDDVVETILPRGSITRPPVSIRNVKITYDAALDKVGVVTTDNVVDLDNLAPGFWVTRNYSKILYDRTERSEIDQYDLQRIFEQIAKFLKKEHNIYILPANEGRLLDTLRAAGDDEYADLMPCKQYVEHLFNTTKILDYLCEATTDLEIQHSSYIKDAINIYKTKFNVQSSETANIIDLIKKAIRPAIPGEVSVPKCVIERLRTVHSNDRIKISNYGEKLNLSVKELNKIYPLLPTEMTHISQINDFVSNISMYDEYVYAVKHHREVHNKTVAIAP